jgi:adenylate cyclase
VTVSLDAIRNCLEGAVPAVIATCAPDGTPNVAYLSHVHFVDNQHVALSFQFFNKTRNNVLANPRATVEVVDPDTGGHYRLRLEYLRTETAGALFEYMKARLAGIASHTGMSKVFRLQGADVYRVLDIECVPGTILSAVTPRPSLLSAMRRCSERIAAHTDLAALIDEVLCCLTDLFDIRHAMLLMLDRARQTLYTVGSRGYDTSGVGSEIVLGHGVIGVAARECAPIRIGHMAQEYLYSRVVRERQHRRDLETEIPLPGLQESRSQLAVPITFGARLLGVLYVESPQDLRFTYEDEDALVALAAQLGMAIHLAEQVADIHDDSPAPGAVEPPVGGAPVTVRHYGVDDSVFLDDQYLIKGVAGAIFWSLVRQHTERGRTEFTNRELRLDPTIPLPDVSENLEARLILLQRRLADRCDCIHIEKTGRGRFRLQVERPLELVEVQAGPAR